jgi:polysaccharide chain length determinant protein (PEP-CTERM system associated)
MIQNTKNKVKKLGAQTAIVGVFSLKNLIEIFIRRFWLIPLPLILIPCITVGISYLIVPSYMSTTTIALGKSEILNPLVRYDTAVALTELNRLNLFKKIVYSRPLLEETISRLGLDADIHSQIELENRLNNIHESIQLFTVDSDSFQIGCSMSDPVLARDVVQTISNLFIEKSLEGSRREASVAVNFIREQMENYESKLQKSEATLELFQSENIHVMQRMNTLAEQLEANRKERIQAELKLEATELKVSLLQKRLASLSPMVVESALYQGENVFRSQIKRLEIDLAKLLSTHLEEHRDVLALRREIEQLKVLDEKEENQNQASQTKTTRSVEYDQTSSTLESLKIEVNILSNSIEQYKTMENRIFEELKLVPDLERKKNNLEEDVKTNRELFNTLKLKLEHAKVSQEVENAAQSNRFSIIEPPLIPLQRYKPKRLFYIIGGLIGGLIVALSIIIFIEIFDARIIRGGEIVDRFDLQIAGVFPSIHIGLPKVSKLKKIFRGSKLSIDPAIAPNAILSIKGLEHINQSNKNYSRTTFDLARDIRSLLLAMERPKHNYAKGNLVGFFCASGKEGASTLACNLAILAATDRKEKTLFIDTNFHHPSISTLLKNESQLGLADVLSRKCYLRKALHSTIYPHLDILPVGNLFPGANQMLTSLRMQSVLEKLKNTYPLIVMDIPAIMSHPESKGLITSCDYALLVARLYETRLSSINASIEKVGLQNLSAFVINGQEHWIPDWLYKLV